MTKIERSAVCRVPWLGAFPLLFMVIRRIYAVSRFLATLIALSLLIGQSCRPELYGESFQISIEVGRQWNLSVKNRLLLLSYPRRLLLTYSLLVRGSQHMLQMTTTTQIEPSSRQAALEYHPPTQLIGCNKFTAGRSFKRGYRRQRVLPWARQARKCLSTYILANFFFFNLFSPQWRQQHSDPARSPCQ